MGKHEGNAPTSARFGQKQPVIVLVFFQVLPNVLPFQDSEKDLVQIFVNGIVVFAGLGGEGNKIRLAGDDRIEQSPGLTMYLTQMHPIQVVG